MDPSVSDIVALDQSDQNQAALDPWSVVHFGVGLASGLVEMRTDAALGAAVGYEIVEQVVERRKLGRELLNTTGPESLPNALMDVAVFMAGHWLGRRWNRSG